VMSWKSRSRVSSRSWIVVANIIPYRGYSGYKPIFYQFENKIISEYDWLVWNIGIYLAGSHALDL
jgi:hypothetical protein